MKTTPQRFAKLIKALVVGEFNKHELADYSGLSPRTIHSYVKALHEQKIIYIDHYEEDSLGRNQSKVFKVGQGKDAVARKYDDVERYRRRMRKKEGLKMIHLMAGPIKKAKA